MEKDVLTSHKQIELRSEEVQEVLGQVPPWILRSGITALFIIVIVLLIGSWFYKYPDIIEAPLIITSNNPPIQINAKVNGKITQLLVSDKQQVKSSDYLAVIENPAITRDVLQLKEKLSVWQNTISNESYNFIREDLNRKLELGDIQTPYLAFIRSAHNYNLFSELNYYPKRIAAIEEQINKQQQYYQRLFKQYEVVQQQFEVAQRQFGRDSAMNAQGLITKSEHDVGILSFLQSRHTLESSRIALDNANIQIDQLQQSILDLQLQELEKQSQLQTEIKTSFDNLFNAVNTWEITYVLKTPVNGIVDISKYLFFYCYSNQYILPMPL